MIPNMFTCVFHQSMYSQLFSDFAQGVTSISELFQTDSNMPMHVWTVQTFSRHSYVFAIFVQTCHYMSKNVQTPPNMFTTLRFCLILLWTCPHFPTFTNNYKPFKHVQFSEYSKSWFKHLQIILIKSKLFRCIPAHGQTFQKVSKHFYTVPVISKLV